MIQSLPPDSFPGFVLGIASIVVVGGGGWVIRAVIRNRNDLDQFRLEVSERYIKKDELAEVKMEMRDMSKVLYEIAGKLGVPPRNIER